MALIKREIYRQVREPNVTHADRCTLIFDTDTKSLYIEREVAHLEASVDGTIEMQTATMDIADYLKQGDVKFPSGILCSMTAFGTMRSAG
jgi:hypothetical protein